MPEEFGYAFAEMLHEPGRKTVLGRRFGEGEAEGERAIRELCRHRSTATFLAGKLVRHFVADDPPADALARVARIFLETQGDLREVARALIHLDAAWAPEHAKFRTPQDWLVAAARALGATAASPGSMALLGQLRHPLWAPPSPKGYGDTVREWADPDALMNRAELARTLAGRVRRTPDTRVLAELVDVPADDPLRGVLADELVPVDERVALALAGPAFQWR